jgi:hypothetical protein
MIPELKQADTGRNATSNTIPQKSSIDIDRISFLDLDATEEENARFERPINIWIWTSVCLGLFLGAFLYGKPP